MQSETPKPLTGDQPAPGRPVARLHGRAHARRRHARPPHPRQLPHRPQGRLHASHERPELDRADYLEQIIPRPRVTLRQGWPTSVGIPGRLASEWVAGFVGIRIQPDARVAAGQIAYPPRLAVVPAELIRAARTADRFFPRRTRVTTRASGSPNTPLTCACGRKPGNRYASSRRRCLAWDLAMTKACQKSGRRRWTAYSTPARGAS